MMLGPLPCFASVAFFDFGSCLVWCPEFGIFRSFEKVPERCGRVDVPPFGFIWKGFKLFVPILMSFLNFSIFRLPLPEGPAQELFSFYCCRFARFSN